MVNKKILMLLVVWIVLVMFFVDGVLAANRLAYENFDDADLDWPCECGPPCLEGTDYTFETPGRGGSGYSYQHGIDTNTQAGLWWNTGIPDPWPSDEIYLSYWLRHTEYTYTYPHENMKINYFYLPNNLNYVSTSIINTNSVNYACQAGGVSVYNTNVLANLLDGSWHQLEYYINFDTNIVRFWIDGDLKIEHGGVDAWTGTINYLAAPSVDAQEVTNFTRQVDDWEVWDGMPSVECNDSMDNDGDGQTDFPDDTGCSSLSDSDETNCDDRQCEGGETCLSCELDCGVCLSSCDGLSLLMHFDKNPAYEETDTFVYDFSGTGNDGIVSGATWNPSGKFGGTFDYNGLDNYISIDDSVSLDAQDFTVSLWAKNIASTIGWNRLISKKNVYTSSDGWEITLVSGSSTDIYLSGSSSINLQTSCVTDWIDGLFHHIVAVYSGSTVYLYCDGNFKDSGTIDAIMPNTYPLALGTDADFTDTVNWEGQIDEVAIWNRALSSSEISQIYTLGVPITCGASMCSSGADSDTSGDVSITEIMNYITQWKAGSVTITALMTGIGEWKNGC